MLVLISTGWHLVHDKVTFLLYWKPGNHHGSVGFFPVHFSKTGTNVAKLGYVVISSGDCFKYMSLGFFLTVPNWINPDSRETQKH